jgi:hypothetical protein
MVCIAALWFRGRFAGKLQKINHFLWNQEKEAEGCDIFHKYLTRVPQEIPNKV